MHITGRRIVSIVIAITIALPPYIPSAMSEMISTEAALGIDNRQELLNVTESFILQEKVAVELSRLGVDREHLMARIRSMTDEELAALADNIDSMPAGAGAIEVIGIVFLVLLILELVGVTDIFKKL